jgi:hypothetical protein
MAPIGCRAWGWPWPELFSRRATAESPPAAVRLRAPDRRECAGEPCRARNRRSIRWHRRRCSCRTHHRGRSSRAGRCTSRRSRSPHSRHRANNLPRTDQRPRSRDRRALGGGHRADRRPRPTRGRMPGQARDRKPVRTAEETADHMPVRRPERRADHRRVRASGRNTAGRTATRGKADNGRARSRCWRPARRTPS